MSVFDELHSHVNPNMPRFSHKRAHRVEIRLPIYIVINTQQLYYTYLYTTYCEELNFFVQK